MKCVLSGKKVDSSLFFWEYKLKLWIRYFRNYKWQSFNGKSECFFYVSRSILLSVNHKMNLILVEMMGKSLGCITVSLSLWDRSGDSQVVWINCIYLEWGIIDALMLKLLPLHMWWSLDQLMLDYLLSWNTKIVVWYFVWLG